MSITRHQANDLLAENYGSHWSYDDPEWWDEMAAMLMEFKSVRHLRRSTTWANMRIPQWWPGAKKQE